MNLKELFLFKGSMRLKHYAAVNCAVLALTFIIGFHQQAPLLKAQETVPLLGLTNTVWKYLQGQCREGIGWVQPDFDDASWPSGLALLAFETNPAITPFVHTMLDPPSFVNGEAVYFRTHIHWTDPTVTVVLEFSNYVDDCVAIYLNGNLLTNAGVTEPITCTSFGRAAIQGDAITPEVFRIPATLLAGDNVLAVEVHQMNATSGDVVWGCALSVVIPRMIIRASGSEVNLCWAAERGVTYRVEFRSDLHTGAWATLHDCLSSTEPTMCMSESFRATPSGFFRVVMVNCVALP
jgi:hypothetical protein